MTIFVKAKGSWFSFFGSAHVSGNDPTGEELYMQSLETKTEFPEDIDDFYDSPFVVNEAYLMICDGGQSFNVYFDGMFNDEQLQFSSPKTDIEDTRYYTNRLGIGKDCLVVAKSATLRKGDRIILNGTESVIMETDDDVTLINYGGKAKLFLTSYLRNTIY